MSDCRSSGDHLQVSTIIGTLPADDEGDVNGFDFLLWQRGYTGIQTVTTVPEPSALLLMCLAVGAFVSIRSDSRLEFPAQPNTFLSVIGTPECGWGVFLVFDSQKHETSAHW